jgi:putative ABC transport system substrate-binding protein
MNKRDALLALATFCAMPRSAMAQARTVLIGVLVGRRNSIFLPGILKRLGEVGYGEGTNLAIEYRSAEGVPERFPVLAHELIQAKCDLILAIGSEQGARALLEAKSSIPVVIFANEYDPVRAGIVPNLQRPGGNITGVFMSQIELAAKRLELMRATLPAAARYLVLGDAFTKEQLDATRQAARRLRIEIVEEIFGSPPYDIEAAFARNRTRQVDALIVLASPLLFEQSARISRLTVEQRLPGSVGYPVASLGETGFLMTYNADLARTTARAGDIAARILKGTKPGEIPVEQATNYELVINLKTAKALAITVPQSILIRADLVIE